MSVSSDKSAAHERMCESSRNPSNPSSSSTNAVASIQDLQAPLQAITRGLFNWHAFLNVPFISLARTEINPEVDRNSEDMALMFYWLAFAGEMEGVTLEMGVGSMLPKIFSGDKWYNLNLL